MGRVVPNKPPEAKRGVFLKATTLVCFMDVSCSLFFVVILYFSPVRSMNVKVFSFIPPSLIREILWCNPSQAISRKLAPSNIN